MANARARVANVQRLRKKRTHGQEDLVPPASQKRRIDEQIRASSPEDGAESHDESSHTRVSNSRPTGRKKLNWYRTHERFRRKSVA